MEDILRQLKEHTAIFMDLMAAAHLMRWDEETHMPHGGTQARADQIATLQLLAHRQITDEKVGRLLDDLEKYRDQLPPDSDEAALIRVTRREYDRRTKVPPELMAEIHRTSSLSLVAWREARASNNFPHFEPLLSRMIDLKKQWAACFAPCDNLLDPLLDDYEPGITTQQVADVFAGLRPELVALVQAISARADAVDDSVLHRHYDPDRQLAFARQVVARLGYDFDRGRLDLVAHPFTTGFSRDDVRITTRVYPDFLPACLMATIHEAGHAIYGQNVNPAYYRTLLSYSASQAASEAQARFYENIIGRSRPFWQYFFPQLQETFPHLADVDVETFYRALNRSQPSLIRVEADEVTYGLHIILRFELENDLINDRVRVADLPRVWNERMEAYLGVVPPTDAEGVLQDVHWAMGYVGYFPAYHLGNLFTVQLWEALKKAQPDIEEQIAAGEFGTVLAWLREQVHWHGRKYTLPRLVERITGGPLDWRPYIAYLRDKYGEIYGFS